MSLKTSSSVNFLERIRYLFPFHELRNRQCFLQLMWLLDQGPMLDGNGGLIGEGLEQPDLFAGEHVRNRRVAIDHATALSRTIIGTESKEHSSSFLPYPNTYPCRCTLVIQDLWTGEVLA